MNCSAQGDPNADKHVEFLLKVILDAGSIPASSTILNEVNMLIKIKENATSCGMGHQGTIVDAAVNPDVSIYPAAVYFDGYGLYYHLSGDEFDSLEVTSAIVVEIPQEC